MPFACLRAGYRRAAVVCVTVPGILLVGPALARAATGRYVSLGDSYTLAPLVPFPTGNPIGCGRSTSNYPSDVGRVIAPRSFADASCASATTTDMTQPQSVPFGGTNRRSSTRSTRATHW